jgi:hypothetical protein
MLVAEVFKKKFNKFLDVVFGEKKKKGGRERKRGTSFRILHYYFDNIMVRKPIFQTT